MGTHHRGPIRETRALDAYIKLIRAAESLSARVHKHLAGSGLTLRQFAVLEALYHLGPMCQRDVASKILTTGGNVTVVVDNLESLGLARRRREASNRRFVRVDLTPRGRRVIRSVFPRHVRRIVDELAVLSPAEQTELDRLCRKLGRARAH